VSTVPERLRRDGVRGTRKAEKGGSPGYQIKQEKNKKKTQHIMIKKSTG
jgi:hypothetical protein